MADNLNLTTTVEAWADIVIKNWQRKIVELDIGSTGALFDSFKSDVIDGANGIPERVEFAMDYYGVFVDMGVGNGTTLETRGSGTTSRKAKAWKSKVLYNQVNRLSKILAEKYGIIGASVISENVVDINNKTWKGSTVATQSGHTGQPSKLNNAERAWMQHAGLLNT